MRLYEKAILLVVLVGLFFFCCRVAASAPVANIAAAAALLPATGMSLEQCRAEIDELNASIGAATTAPGDGIGKRDAPLYSNVRNTRRFYE